MALRFSDQGPEFPTALVDALMMGEVVFLCGTGISAPQLPDFKTLVDQTFEVLGVVMNRSEQKAYDALRYEEVLGALARRLADPGAMVRTVAGLLAVPADPRLDQHRTILRLSRDLSNRVLTVTTNFDTLLERALAAAPPEVRAQSFAGQALPAPGAAEFAGIIHIHGRLVDPVLDLEATPLVLTSADYGDAYMRSGWASRFLFDLARCKTIVLVGYSANDAPVRYFLNVLEADRERFPDLKSVYALDAYENDPVDAEAAWGTVAVTPLVYRKVNPVTGVHDHSSLWQDLEHLAGVVERPKRSRADRARIMFETRSLDLTDQKLRELSWLFGNRSDLWPTAIGTITDPGWFRVLQENKLWSPNDAAWVIAAWIAKGFEDKARFSVAVEWQEILGTPFLSAIDHRLRQSPPGSVFWLKAWRLLLSAGADRRANADGFDANAYALKEKLGTPLVLDTELTQAVALLAPVLVVRRPFRVSDEDDNGDDGAEAEAKERRLSSLASIDLDTLDHYEASELVAALDALEGKAARILEIASARLCDSLYRSVDVGLIAEDYDTSDYSVPSVEDHPQNEHHGGVLFLVRAIVNAFPKAIAANREGARAQAAQWANWPGRIGSRLQLHVARDPGAFSADEALQIVLDLDDVSFWVTRREMALALRDRSAEAAEPLRTAIETRIRETGDAYFKRYSIEADEVDWRAHARDSAVWLRLKMLDAAGVLSPEGKGELAAIIARRDYLDREPEDRDFFSTYSSGVRAAVGDAAPILEAEPDDRLKVASELSLSPDIDRQMGWRAYCRSDPRGALDTLSAAAVTPSNLALWKTFLASLAVRPDEDDRAGRDQLAVEAMARLKALEDDALQVIADSAVDLLMFGPCRLVANLEDWCDRLWSAVRVGDQEIDYEKNVYDTAINRSPGRLAQVLLSELDHTRNNHGPDEQRQLARLDTVAAEEAPAGILARAVFIHDFAFLLGAAEPMVLARLVPRIDREDEEGRSLRSILVSQGAITPAVSKLLPGAIIRGVIEVRPDTGFASQIASGVLRPALAAIRGDEPEKWGIGVQDVARILREAPLKIRTGALDVLYRWMRSDEAGAEQAWDAMVAPFFDRVWPKERRFLDEALHKDLMGLAVDSDARFPEALAKLRPYFSAYSRNRTNIFPIKRSQAPEQFPAQVLDLVWIIFGPSGDTSYEMAEVLDRLIKADPAIEVDRRLQSLEQRTMRFS